jgi:hypothetical protein
MLALAKDVNQLYSDLIGTGGLVNALEIAFRNIGSPHTVFRRSVNVGVVCARVEDERHISPLRQRRRCQAYIVDQQRLFVFDLWKGDSILVGATAASLIDVAGRIHTWLATPCLAADVVAGLERVSVHDDGMLYDSRDDVELAWRSVMDSDDRWLTAFAQEASQREKLRQLLPYGGSHYLGFSRCTRHPFTRDIPIVWPSGDGVFRVTDDFASHKVFGRGDAAYAADLIQSLLPPYCGPAVSGTCDSLEVLPPDLL